jgi:hypothetical protein
MHTDRSQIDTEVQVQGIQGQGQGDTSDTGTGRYTDTGRIYTGTREIYRRYIQKKIHASQGPGGALAYV